MPAREPMAGNSQFPELSMPLVDRQRTHQEKLRERDRNLSGGKQPANRRKQRKEEKGKRGQEKGRHRLELGATLGVQRTAEACKLAGIRKGEEVINGRSMCRCKQIWVQGVEMSCTWAIEHSVRIILDMLLALCRTVLAKPVITLLPLPPPRLLSQPV